MGERTDDKPVTGLAVTMGDMLTIVMHPAFRIGFLDARDGKSFDYDDILGRIEKETPAGALARIGWPVAQLDFTGDMLDPSKPTPKQKRFALAQYRYEEGRKAFVEYGLRCKAWGHPDYPPVQVMTFCREEAARRTAQKAAAVAATA